MADATPINVHFGFLHQDVPEKLVDDMLRRQRSQELFQRVSQQQWDLLQITHPNLIHYISTVSYEVARHDPVLREQVAANLLGLYALLDETVIEHNVAQLHEPVAETSVLPKSGELHDVA